MQPDKIFFSKEDTEIKGILFPFQHLSGNHLLAYHLQLIKPQGICSVILSF